MLLGRNVVSALVLVLILLLEIHIFSNIVGSFPNVQASGDNDHVEREVLNGLQKAIAAQIQAKKELVMPLSIFEANFEKNITAELAVDLQIIAERNQILFFKSLFTDTKRTLDYEDIKTHEDDLGTTCYSSPNSGCFSTSN